MAHYIDGMHPTAWTLIKASKLYEATMLAMSIKIRKEKLIGEVPKPLQQWVWSVLRYSIPLD
jgi:hypothetical protein